jgi:hypothetical protein
MRSLANQHDCVELQRRLQSVTADSQRRWGRMSAHQMICHLSDSFRMVTGDKRVRTPRGRVRPALIKTIALYAPLPWPHGIPTVGDLDQLKGGTRPLEFAADLAELTALVDRVAAWQNCPGQMHPLFGRMSQAAWRRWGYLHVDHHLRQFGV